MACYPICKLHRAKSFMFVNIYDIYKCHKCITDANCNKAQKPVKGIFPGAEALLTDFWMISI